MDFAMSVLKEDENILASLKCNLKSFIDFTIVDEEQQYQIKSRKRSKFGKKKLLQERNEETKTEQLQEPEVMVRNQILKY